MTTPRDASAGDAAARLAASSPVGDGGVPEAGGVDLQPDVERIHRAIRREPRDPDEGREPAPWFLWAAVAVALFWGGWYLGRYGGEFDTTPHLAFGARQPGIAAAAAEQASSAATDPVARGQTVFAQHCQSCHQSSGKGVTGAFPPVVGSEWVTGAPETLVRILLHGLQGPVQVAGQPYNGAMPAWRESLKDEEIAAVATYLRQWKPNAAGAVAPTLVAQLREATASRSAPWTAADLRAAEGSGPGAGATSAPAPDAPSSRVPATSGGAASTGGAAQSPASPNAGATTTPPRPEERR